jgi:NADH:ubiquinone reductase (H+-translocating)
MKTLPQAQRLRNHVLACLERATQQREQTEQRRWLTFVVIGGGPTGVEFTGALLELLKLVVGREYPELPPELARVVLIEEPTGSCPHSPRGSGVRQQGARASRRRRSHRHARRTGHARGVLLSDGREIASRTVVWSAGIRATQLAGTDEMPRSRARRLATEEHLQIAGHPGVFAVGDVASMHIDGPELPMLSPPAMQEGRYVAQAILADLRGTRLRQPFATATVHI